MSLVALCQPSYEGVEDYRNGSCFPLAHDVGGGLFHTALGTYDGHSVVARRFVKGLICCLLGYTQERPRMQKHMLLYFIYISRSAL
jgi:hypothetical protein